MTKYQIIAPSGVKVCVIDAGLISREKDDTIELCEDPQGFNRICTIPKDWCVIPVNAILE